MPSFFSKCIQTPAESSPRFLVVRDDRMGDVVLATPVFRALKESFPACTITAMVRPAYRELLNGHPDIDDWVEADWENAHSGWRGWWNIVKQIRRVRADVGFVLWPTSRNMSALYWGGVSSILSFGRKPYQWMWGDGVYRRRLGHLRRHEVENNLEVIGLAGIPASLPRLHLEMTGQELEESTAGYEALGIGPKEKIAGLYPGHGGSAILRMPIDQYVEIARRLTSKGWRVMVLLGKEEIAHQEEWRHAFQGVKVMWAVASSPKSLKAWIHRWTVFVGMSTGPMHVASALGIPVVGIFSPIDGVSPARWRPWGDNHEILKPPISLICPDCFGARCPHFNCLNLIAAEGICQSVERLVGSGRSSRSSVAGHRATPSGRSR